VKQQRLEIIALDDIPSVEPGDNICALIMQSLHSSSIELQDNDVLVVAQKVISKAENRYTYLNSITPDKNTSKIADEVNKDPRVVQAILDESNEILRQRPGVIIVEHKLGYIHANAGIDQSNIESNLHNPRVLLLPEDSDLSAKRIREQFKTQIGVDIAVIINDSAGRAWRNGSIGFAIGTAGFAPLINLVGSPDLYGNELRLQMNSRPLLHF